MQLVSLNNAGPNLTAFQFWAQVGLGPGAPPDEPFIGFGFDTGLSGRAGLAGMSRAVLEIPATGNAGHALNGKTFIVFLMGQPFTFELSDDGSVGPGNLIINISNGDNGATVASEIAAQFGPAQFGFSAGGATARVLGVLPDTNIGVLIEAADPALAQGSDNTRAFSVLATPDTAPLVISGVSIGGTYGHALLGTASKAFVFSGLTNPGDLPAANGAGDPITLRADLLTIVAWPIPRGAGGMRAWIPQLVPAAWVPQPELG